VPIGTLREKRVGEYEGKQKFLEGWRGLQTKKYSMWRTQIFSETAQNDFLQVKQLCLIPPSSLTKYSHSIPRPLFPPAGVSAPLGVTTC